MSKRLIFNNIMTKMSRWVEQLIENGKISNDNLKNNNTLQAQGNSRQSIHRDCWAVVQ